MTKLSEELKLHYKRTTKSIVFSNGYSLNQMALEIWERSGYKGFDSSMLSKVVNGKRIFSASQLQIFCSILKLKPKDKIKIKKSLVQDLLEQRGLEHKSNTSATDLKKILSVARILRTKGLPDESISLVQTTQHLIEDVGFYSENTSQMHKISLSLSLELVRAYGETQGAGQMGRLTKLNNYCINLAQKLRDQKILDMAYMNKGGCLYVAKQWKSSADFLERYYPKVGDLTKIEFLRTLLLNYIFLKDIFLVKATLKRIFILMDRINYDNNNEIASLIEAISRSFLYLGLLKEARTILELVKVNGLDPFFQSQILRCKAIMIWKEYQAKKTVDLDKLYKIQSEMNSSRLTHYIRHKKQINYIIGSINYY